jgi:hypothetical protein
LVIDWSNRHDEKIIALPLPPLYYPYIQHPLGGTVYRENNFQEVMKLLDRQNCPKRAVLPFQERLYVLNLYQSLWA